MKIKLSKSQWEKAGKQAGWIKTADDFQTGGRIKSITIPVGKYNKSQVSLDFDGPNAIPSRFNKIPLVTIIWTVYDSNGKHQSEWITWRPEDKNPEEFLPVVDSVAALIQKLSGTTRSKVLSDLCKEEARRHLQAIGGIENKWF